MARGSRRVAQEQRALTEQRIVEALAAVIDEAKFLLRTVLLLTSPMAWLHWKDYLGLGPGEAATAGWASTALAGPA